jgi:hypothetical protein
MAQCHGASVPWRAEQPSTAAPGWQFRRASAPARSRCNKRKLLACTVFSWCWRNNKERSAERATAEALGVSLPLTFTSLQTVCGRRAFGQLARRVLQHPLLRRWAYRHFDSCCTPVVSSAAETVMAGRLSSLSSGGPSGVLVAQPFRRWEPTYSL